MKINTTFNVGDTAYVLENKECYRVKIEAIDIVIKESAGIDYRVTKFIPAGILKETEKGAAYGEEQLFLTKGEVKDKLKEIEEHRKKKEELEGYMKDNSINYFDIRNTEYVTAATALDIKTI